MQMLSNEMYGKDRRIAYLVTLDNLWWGVVGTITTSAYHTPNVARKIQLTHNVFDCTCSIRILYGHG